MVKSVFNPQKLLSVLAVLYILTRYMRWQINELHPFIAFHFTDLLFIPMQLTFCLIILRFLKRNNDLTIPAVLVYINTLLMSLLFEWYLPIHRQAALQTADTIDVLMYFIGASLFLLMQRKWFSTY